MVHSLLALVLFCMQMIFFCTAPFPQTRLFIHTWNQTPIQYRTGNMHQSKENFGSILPACWPGDFSIHCLDPDMEYAATFNIPRTTARTQALDRQNQCGCIDFEQNWSHLVSQTASHEITYLWTIATYKFSQSDGISKISVSPKSQAFVRRVCTAVKVGVPNLETDFFTK